MLDQFMQNVGDLRQNGWCHFRKKPVLVKNEYISGFEFCAYFLKENKVSVHQLGPVKADVVTFV